MANIGWAFGVLKGNGVDTDDMEPEEAFDELERLREEERANFAKSKKKKRYIELPKKEYAEICSAIRTMHANKIPKQGGLFYKNSFYEYNCSHNDKITCREKLDIEKDQDKIRAYRSNLNGD